ncbi:MAG: hypothetical protein U0573_03745 [Phycisphaerales bacterium]|nr:hypothetical protein [Planctomycetota bacterium]
MDLVRRIATQLLVILAVVGLVLLVVLILFPAAVLGGLALLIRAAFRTAVDSLRGRGGIPAHDSEGRENVRVRRDPP